MFHLCSVNSMSVGSLECVACEWVSVSVVKTCVCAEGTEGEREASGFVERACLKAKDCHCCYTAAKVFADVESGFSSDERVCVSFVRKGAMSVTDADVHDTSQCGAGAGCTSVVHV